MFVEACKRRYEAFPSGPNAERVHKDWGRGPRGIGQIGGIWLMSRRGFLCKKGADCRQRRASAQDEMARRKPEASLVRNTPTSLRTPRC